MDYDLRAHATKWKKEEEDLIRDLYTDLTDHELGVRLGRTRRSIKTKREKMGLFLYFQENSAPIKNEKRTQFNDKLEVSNRGRVRKDKVKYLKLGVHKTGYVTVSILGKLRYLHNIVREAFNGPMPSGYEVDHKDCNKLNNSLRNLEKVTHQENMKRAYDNGCRTNFFGK